MEYVLLIVGFLVLIKSASLFVDAVSSFSLNMRIPKMIVTLTIVAFATSSPELAISFNAMASGNGDLVIGNVLGSTIVNTLLIIGISAIITPLRVKKNTIKKELPIHLLVITIFAILLIDSLFDTTIPNTITRNDALALLLAFMVFVYYLIYTIKKNHAHEEALLLNKEENVQIEAKYNTKKSIIFAIIGLLGIIISSDLVVDNTVSIARIIGISEKFITLTVLVIGTSLPELVTSIIAARKKDFDFILGNIIGTNIFNLCIVLGVPVLVYGNISTTGYGYIDVLAILLAGFSIYLFSLDDARLKRKEGFIMLSIFVVYYIYIFMMGR